MFVQGHWNTYHQSSKESENSDVWECVETYWILQKNIPSSLQICDMFFTQMIMVGSFNCKEGNIPIHVDDDDFVSSRDNEGASTPVAQTYYAPLKVRNLLSMKYSPF